MSASDPLFGKPGAGEPAPEFDPDSLPLQPAEVQLWSIFARMQKAVDAGKGCRLSFDDLARLEASVVGEFMGDAARVLKTNPRAPE